MADTSKPRTFEELMQAATSNATELAREIDQIVVDVSNRPCRRLGESDADFSRRLRYAWVPVLDTMRACGVTIVDDSADPSTPEQRASVMKWFREKLRP